ncbi:MAG TPA: DUF3300 domain-containing protein [Steroidobacteraceae bacterium]|nr:DUF3300 domain-containing protein [Steroidobacteraceae bacterium]
MNILDRADECRRTPRSVWFALCLSLLVLAATRCLAQGAAQAPPTEPPPPPYVQQSPEQLQQLVAPIALYPDPLVAQVLAASTFPEQVVEADRWLQANPGLTGQALADAANRQPWDASVKALTAFPAVLGNMDRNLSWTSSLGDAYYNQPQDVMNAVQVMRQRAQAAGNLRTTPQQVVTTEGPAISIEPASPDVVYVPAFDPWVVYGAPVLAWPDWYAYPGIWFAGPYLSFGIGFPIAFFGGFGWGWSHWGFNWHDHAVLFDRRPYFSRSTTFFNRGRFYGAGGAPRGGAGFGRGGADFGRGASRLPSTNFGAGRGMFNGSGARPLPFNGSAEAARGYAEPRGQSGMRSGAFSDYNRGGEARGFSARGAQSFGGGFRGGGGGGGFHGGGGGGRR